MKPLYALKRLLVSPGRWVNPGDLIPGSDNWPFHIRRAYINSRHVTETEPVTNKPVASGHNIEYKCDKCGQAFKTKGALSTHKVHKHK